MMCCICFFTCIVLSFSTCGSACERVSCFMFHVSCCSQLVAFHVFLVVPSLFPATARIMYCVSHIMSYVLLSRLARDCHHFMTCNCSKRPRGMATFDMDVVVHVAQVVTVLSVMSVNGAGVDTKLHIPTTHVASCRHATFRPLL